MLLRLVFAALTGVLLPECKVRSIRAEHLLYAFETVIFILKLCIGRLFHFVLRKRHQRKREREVQDGTLYRFENKNY